MINQESRLILNEIDLYIDGYMKAKQNFPDAVHLSRRQMKTLRNAVRAELKRSGENALLGGLDPGVEEYNGIRLLCSFK